MMDRPALYPNGHILIVTIFPPATGGSSVIMHNLLSNFDPSSYSVATVSPHLSTRLDVNTSIEVHSIMSSIRLSGRLNAYWRDIQMPFATWKLDRLVREKQPKAIVGVFPYYHLLEVSRRVALKYNIPWIPYLHDTLAEALSRGKLADHATILQRQIFQHASKILVMSQGMKELFEKKYRVKVESLEHSYPEEIPDNLSTDIILQRQAFWGGAIYRINRHSLARISEALKEINLPFLITSGAKRKRLESYGIVGKHIKREFFSVRNDYLRILQRQEILILALDWPDESPIHEDELATIFPTKTPEYLASGRPILLHCPDHYFLARFFEENQCGLVVAERSVDKLIKACQYLLEGGPEVDKMRQSALNTAHNFALARVAKIFKDEVEDVIQIK
jgi:glycosyltransferase involved in cell wall biosynthesis